MNKQARRGGQRWTLSILLHLGLIGVAAGIWYWSAHRPRAVQSMGIEARVVTSDAMTQRPPPLPVPVVPMPDPEPEPEPEPPPPDPGPTQEEIAAQEAEAARVEEQRQLAAARAEAERKAAAERAENERRRKEAEEAARRKAQQEEAERQRLAREQAEREKAAAEQRQREEQLSAQLAEEERQARLRNSDLMARYVDQIANQIERNWKRPLNAVTGINCQVHVTQIPGGTVTAVEVTRCNGDATVVQSIKDAVARASPLPRPPDPALFERDLVVTFRPD